jgi:hypothetical protein
VGVKQQKSQQELAFASSGKVKPEAPLGEGTETLAARSRPESQAGNERLMEVMLERAARPLLLSTFVIVSVSTEPPGTDPYAGWCGRGVPRGFSLSRSSTLVLG